MSEIADQILEAVDIIVDKKVSDLAFNKTIRGKISQVVDASIGEYKIQYQNSYFTAYSADSSATYQKGAEVYVEILSNDFEKNALILGTVQRLGSNYVSIVEKLDKYTSIGEEFSSDAVVEFCSYGGSQSQILFQSSDKDTWKLDNNLIKEAAAASDSLKIGLKIKNNLSAEQRRTRGDFGLKVVVIYYDEIYDETYIAQNSDSDNEGLQLEREYIFNVNEMTGQPYKYVSYTDQYYVFPIDAKNFIRIKSIEAFCKNFNTNDNKTDIDIWFKDFNLQFLESLKEEELQDTSLKILTPKGFCFSDNQINNKLLQAELKIKGKPVNLATQTVDFFWHIRDAKASSTYGGRGWRQLNQATPGAYKQEITIDQCAAAETEFKCVACYFEQGQSVQSEAKIIIKNIQDSQPNLSIESTMGKIFAFNTGLTTLELKGYTAIKNTHYTWLESIDGGNAVEVEDSDFNQITVAIKTPSAKTLNYICSVYENEILIGSASITLVNNKEALGYTLVINNASQIFKYDTYGVSPASKSLAEADQLKIEPLTFDIYDKQGNPIYFEEGSKNKFMTINWIWPDNTLLTTKSELINKPILDIVNNEIVDRQVYIGEKLVFGIAEKYNAEIANASDAMNNIELEVEYQGELLKATTNFTFTKEGELGTNGTKYVAKIVPKNDYAEIFIQDNNLYAIQYVNNAESTERFRFVQLTSRTSQKNLNEIFEAQLWNGAEQILNPNVSWSLSSSTERTGNSRLTIDKNRGIIRISNNGTSNFNIIQATITFDRDNKKLKYYATYPIMYTDRLLDGNLVYIDGGYREVIYESDGTRGHYSGRSFYPRVWTKERKRKLNQYETDELTNSWDAEVKDPDSAKAYQIEPPHYYIAEVPSHIVSLTVSNGTTSATTYLPIEMYLNRYGMAAMNDWDGNSIKIQDTGNNYILAPQIGAGSKDNQNRFTGITIGEVFESNDNKDIGLFGYGAGARTIFLDAKTGNATFGVSGNGQIQIRADGEGAIQSGDYSSGNGMKIKFSSTNKDGEAGPYIKFGSGHFSVNNQGNITAKGGGTIAGWKITDTYLESDDGDTILYANNNNNNLRFSIGSNKQFTVDANGAITSTAGTIGGWIISTDSLKSNDNNTVLYATNSHNNLRISIGSNQQFTVDKDGKIVSTAGTIGGWTINSNSLSSGSGAITLTDDGYILGPTSTGSDGFGIGTKGFHTWGIANNGTAYFTDIKIKNNLNNDNNSFSWYMGEQSIPVLELKNDTCQMGGYSITGTELYTSTGNLHLYGTPRSPDNVILSANEVFKIYGNGNISASGGSIGGCAISGGGISGSGWALNSNSMEFGGDTVQLQSMKTPIGIEWGNTYKRIDIQTGWLSVDENNKITGYILIPDIKLRFNEYSVMRTKEVQLDAYYTTNRQGDN